MAKLTYKEAYLRLQELSEKVNSLDLSDLDWLSVNSDRCPPLSSSHASMTGSDC